MADLLIPIANVAYYLTLFFCGVIVSYALTERSFITACIGLYLAWVLIMTKVVL